ncbi:hypothetical protein ACA910_014185 [Epithemia clementina (nom. ined.)]
MFLSFLFSPQQRKQRKLLRALTFLAVVALVAEDATPAVAAWQDLPTQPPSIPSSSGGGGRRETPPVLIGRRPIVVDLPFATAAAAVSSILGRDLSKAYAAEPAWAMEARSTVLLPRSNSVFLPRIGYSLYKTVPEQVSEGVALALVAGVRHFDCASQYGTNAEVGRVLKEYIQTGKVETRDGTIIATATSTTPQQRRNGLFLTHKVSNSDQSLSKTELQRDVLEQARVLVGGTSKTGGGNKNNRKPLLDLVMVHSPLTDKNRRISTHAALCELLDQGKIGAVGVCHFGVTPLQELVDAGLPAPSVIQLELSPFNQHADVAAWAAAHDSLLSCAAWSKLSSNDGPIQGWDILGSIAKERGMTKQQVLIRWAIQRGYLCVPRSSSQYKIERQAIQENSWDATKDFVLSDKEMTILNGLDEKIPAGQLGVKDGWEESDIVDRKWDPTTAIV